MGQCVAHTVLRIPVSGTWLFVDVLVIRMSAQPSPSEVIFLTTHPSTHYYLLYPQLHSSDTLRTCTYLLSQDEWWHPQHWSGYAQSVSGCRHTLHQWRRTASQGHWMWCCWQEHDGKALWQQYCCPAAAALTCPSAAGGTGAAVSPWQTQQSCE